MFNSYFSKKIEDITYLIKNEKFHVILAIIFLSFLPATLLMGSAIINVFSVCIIIFFTIDMWKGGEKFPNDIFFYLLLIFWLSLIINLIFSNYLWASLPRSIGFDELAGEDDIQMREMRSPDLPDGTNERFNMHKHLGLSPASHLCCDLALARAPLLQPRTPCSACNRLWGGDAGEQFF